MPKKWHFRHLNCHEAAGRLREVHTSTSNLPLIRLSSVNPFLTELARRNVDGGAILRGKGLPGDVPASSDLFASSLTIYEIVEQSAAVADDPYLGYTIGRNLNAEDWEPVARAVHDANTIGDLLRNFIVNALDHSSSTEFFMRTEGERTTFGFARATVPPFKPSQNDAFYLGFFIKLLRNATGPAWDPAQVLARVSSPSAIPRTEEMSRLAETDNAGMRISFPTEWQLSKIHKAIGGRANQSAGGQQLPESLVESVRAALRPHVNEADLDVAKAAKICGYEKRRLGRLLRRHGTTIIKEISAVREESARDKLLNSATPVAEIGESVGFNDPTIFSRAFKNWTGQSPQAFRRTHRT